MIKEVFGLALSMGCIVMMERQLLTLKGNRLEMSVSGRATVSKADGSRLLRIRIG